MSDELRRSLARAAGDGDIDAARKLLTLLQRESLARDWPLSPDQIAWHLTDEDFGGRKGSGRRVRVLNVIQRALPVADLRTLSLKTIASVHIDRFVQARDCGQTTLAALDAVLARAGLRIEGDPTLNVFADTPPSPTTRSVAPSASPPASSSSSEGTRT
jgi:hypothetical protein